MSDDITIGGGTAILSADLEDGGPFTIHGVALGAGDVTSGSSGTKKKWPPEELKKAVDSLAGKPLVKNHTNTVEGVIGEVTNSKWKDGVGILYEAEIDEQHKGLAEKIANGRLDVSVRAYHAPTEELDEDDDTGAKIVESVRFDNLSVVPNGASPSNTAEIGTAQEMSATELRAEFGSAEGADVEETGGDVSEQSESVETETPVETEEASQSANDDSEADAEEEELADWSFHTPSWSGKTEANWGQPDMKDFDTDDFSEIDDHFLLSKTGFPPENYTDLSSPVVTTDGDLSLGGLRAAIGGHGVQSIGGISDDMTQKVEDWIIKTAKEEFGEEWDGESSAGPTEDEDVEAASDNEPKPTEASIDASDVTILHDDPTGASDDGLGTSTGFSVNFSDSIMTELEDEIEAMDEPVVIEDAELESIKEKAGQYEDIDGSLEEMSATLEDLSADKDLLEDAGRELVEELADDESEKTVVDEDELSMLRDEVENIKGLYAEELAEYVPMDAEMLEGKFSVSELSEMMDETEDAELAESVEADEPDVKGGSATEDELEENPEEEELAEEKREELREDYAEHYEDLGWSAQAEKVRNGDISLEEMGVEL